MQAIQIKIIINSKMREIIKKRRNQPVKSPSPDIVNRSQIKSTTVEVDDIKHLLIKAKQTEKQYEIESSFSYLTSQRTSQLKSNNLREQYSILKEQYRLVIEQNKILNGQINILREESKKQRSSTGIDQFEQFIIRKESDGELIINQLRQRLIQFSEQNKRLLKQLQRQNHLNDQLAKDNESLRRNIIHLNQQISMFLPNFNFKSNTLSGAIDQGKITFNLMANHLLKNYSDKTQQKMIQLEEKIQKVQFLQKLLQAQVNKQPHIQRTPNSIKYDKSEFTTCGKNENSRFKQISPRSRYQKEQNSPAPTSPIAVDYERTNNYITEIEYLKEKIVQKQSDLDLVIEENYRLKRRIEESQKYYHQQQDGKQKKITTPKFIQSFKLDEKFKFGHLPDQTSSQSLQLEIYKLKQKNMREADEHAKQKYQLMMELEEERNKYKTYKQAQEQAKNINMIQTTAKCLNCLSKNQNIKELTERLNRISKQNRENQLALTNQFQQQIESFKAKFNEFEHSQIQKQQQRQQLKLAYQKLIENSKSLVSQFKQYLSFLVVIKSNLSEQSILNLLSQNTQIYSEMENYFLQEKNRTESIFLTLKSQLLIKDEKIAQLQKVASMQNKQIKELQIEKQKLKMIISDYRGLALEQPSGTGKYNNSKVNAFQVNNKKIKDQIEAASQKMDILYQRINIYVQSSVH